TFPHLPAGVDVADGRITARACDDLLGAAAILAALETAAATGADAWGLFTRAEEVGLLGAFEAIRLGTVPPGASVLSLECSKALPDAPQGGGAIVRVGDRMSIFDPVLTEAVRRTAQSAGVTHQRKLMDGGVCEASAFCAAGYRASGVAVALGNYHNAADDGTGVAPEHVAVADYLAEVSLLDALVADPPPPAPGPDERLAGRTAEAARCLRP
ncbi:MAG: M20/M25/M40 family metallo-hydrolase, partial [Actinomycetota bacterium]|nr:M20/M25/M40 family metallo-hydrolase [Actinomycetota bacterium]